jgi:hypothetical protein
VVRENIVLAIGDAEQKIAAFEGASTELLRMVLFSWWDRVGATKASGIIKLVQAEVGNFPELAEFYRREVIERATRMISSLLERGVARGEFRPVDVELMTHVLIAPVLMLITWQHSISPCHRDEMDPHAFIEQFLSLALHGLCPRPGAGA